MRDFRFGVVVLFVGGIAGCVDGAKKQQPDARPIDAPIEADARTIDAFVVDGAVPMPLGTHHRFVVEKEYVAANNTEAREHGLDLNGDISVDNQLGQVFATLSGQGIPFDGSVDRLVDRGESILLVDLQTTDLVTATDAGVTTYEGANPAPAACASVNDMFCRHHLNGNASFTIAAPGVHEIPLVGNFAGGSMTSSSGKLYTPLALFDDHFEMIGGRIQVTTVTATTMTGIVAGCITEEDIDGKIIPRMQMQFASAIARDCSDPAGPPTCGCINGSTGAQFVALFDMDHDCAASVQEVHDNSLIHSLLSPDLLIGGRQCLSYGFKFDAVGAGFTP